MRPSWRQDNGYRLFVTIGVLLVLSVPLYLTRAQTPEKAQNTTEMGSTEDAGDSSSIKESVYSIPEGDVFFRESQPNQEAVATVILLHGAAFSSQTWKEIGTLDALPKAGLRAFAVDLPGFANSQSISVPDRAEFMKGLVNSVGGKVKVLVAPSISGTFAHPYLEKYGEEIYGYVPVAPVGASSFQPSEPVKDQLWLLAVAGDRDRGGIAAVSIFEKLFRNFRKLIIQDGNHPAYLDDPELWNAELVKFALDVAKAKGDS